MSIAFMLCVSLTPPKLGAATANYINEFSEPNEIGVRDSIWQYLTADGVNRTIEVYRYNSLLIPFDITNQRPLLGNQSQEFFENYELRNLVAPGMLTESSYNITFKQSLACQYALPRLDSETKNAVGQGAKEAVADLLPKRAAAIVRELYDIGDDIGLISKTNMWALALGVACYGGDVLENYAATQLQSCQSYITNLRDFKAYQGQVEDLLNCHKDAMAKLDQAKYSPDVLAGFVENKLVIAGTSIWDSIVGIICYFTGCKPPTPKFDSSVLDNIYSEIDTLRKTLPSFDVANSTSITDGQLSDQRISLKMNESDGAIATLSSKIATLNSALSGHGFFDWFNTPNLNLSQSFAQRDAGAALLSQAQQFQDQYRFNSAKAIAQNATPDLDKAINYTIEQNAVPRILSLLRLMVLIVPIMILAFVVWRFAPRSRDDFSD